MLCRRAISLASTQGNAVYDIEYWYTPYMSMCEHLCVNTHTDTRVCLGIRGLAWRMF